MLGLGRERVVRVPVDGQGRMRADALPRARPARRSSACRPATSTPAPSIPFGDDLRAGARARRMGARRRRVRAVGARRAVARHLAAGLEPRRFVGDRRATSGSTCRTTAASPSCATRHALRGRDGHDRGVPAASRACASPSRLHARAVAPRARRRGLGGAAHRSAATGVADLVERNLPPRRALRREPARRRATRSSTTSCSIRCWSRSATRTTTRRVIARVQARRHVLVRRHRLAGPHRDAHQRLVVGDDRRRRRAQPRGDAARRARRLSGSALRDAVPGY